jgi:hypothetical protein
MMLFAVGALTIIVALLMWRVIILEERLRRHEDWWRQ